MTKLVALIAIIALGTGCMHTNPAQMVPSRKELGQLHKSNKAVKVNRFRIWFKS